MKFKRLTVLLLVVTILFSLATPAFAGNDKPKGSKQFTDTKGNEQVVKDGSKAVSKGISKEAADEVFAPGAKITQQEAAVSAVHMIKKEDQAKLLSAAQVENLLGNIPDKDKIASWAKPAVAILVQLGVVAANKSFNPLEPATRLDIAVLLVKVLGYESQAQASMGKTLAYRDAKLIPADKKGYVYVATDLKLIGGYDDRTFRPMQAVKRIEAATMMGRADYLVEKLKDREENQDKVVSGSITRLVAATSSSLAIIYINGVAYPVASNANILLNNNAAAFASLLVEDLATLTISNGIAKSLAVMRTSTISGTITNIVPAAASELAKITINNTMVYNVASNATYKVNGNQCTLADLRLGDNAALNLSNLLVIHAEIVRPATTVNGTISVLTAATASARAKITLNSPSATVEYTLAAGAVIKINGQNVQFSDLRANDTTTLTLGSGLVDKVEVTRAQTVIEGSLIAIGVPIQGQTYPAGTIGLINVIYTLNGVITTSQFPVTISTQILVNAQTALFSGLQLGDAVKLTFAAESLLKVEITR